jgi:hypothetical protein
MCCSVVAKVARGAAVAGPMCCKPPRQACVASSSCRMRGSWCLAGSAANTSLPNVAGSDGRGPAPGGLPWPSSAGQPGCCGLTALCCCCRCCCCCCCCSRDKSVATLPARHASSASNCSRSAGSCLPAASLGWACGSAEAGSWSATSAHSTAAASASSCRCCASCASMLRVGDALEQRSDGAGSGCGGGPTACAAVPAS